MNRLCLASVLAVAAFGAGRLAGLCLTPPAVPPAAGTAAAVPRAQPPPRPVGPIEEFLAAGSVSARLKLMGGWQSLQPGQIREAWSQLERLPRPWKAPVARQLLHLWLAADARGACETLIPLRPVTNAAHYDPFAEPSDSSQQFLRSGVTRLCAEWLESHPDRVHDLEPVIWNNCRAGDGDWDPSGACADLARLLPERFLEVIGQPSAAATTALATIAAADVKKALALAEYYDLEAEPVLQVWAKTDWTAAFEEACRHRNEPAWKGSDRSLLRDWAASHPVEAMPFLQQALNTGSLPNDLCFSGADAAALRIADDDPEAALRWMEILPPDEKFQQQIRMGIVEKLLATNPDRAVRVLAETMATYPGLAESRIGSIADWAIREKLSKESPDEVLAWCQAAPEAVRTRLIESFRRKVPNNVPQPKTGNP